MRSTQTKHTNQEAHKPGRKKGERHTGGRGQGEEGRTRKLGEKERKGKRARGPGKSKK